MEKLIFIFIAIHFFFSQSKTLTKMPDANKTITSGYTSITIDPLTGGRIVSFKIKDYEFLTGMDIHSSGYGSTFWTSPQSVWNWPPPAVLDTDPYSIEEGSNSIKVTSGKDSVTGFQFIKEISAGKKESINLKYSIINVTGKNKNAAPWEISRVHKGGILFFPIGEKPLDKKFFELAEVEIFNGIAWYKDPKERPENKRLSMTDGSEGWMAYAIDGRLFIKKFQDVKTDLQAPGEGEILFYIDSEADFIEIEVQGEYNSLKPGEKSVWEIEWIGAEIPANTNIEVGSNELVQLVRGMVK